VTTRFKARAVVMLQLGMCQWCLTGLARMTILTREYTPDGEPRAELWIPTCAACRAARWPTAVSKPIELGDWCVNPGGIGDQKARALYVVDQPWRDNAGHG
jgi:hypothetical protein